MAMMMPHTIRGMKGRRISRQPITSRAAKPICIDISRASFTSIFRVVTLNLQQRTETQQKLIKMQKRSSVHPEKTGRDSALRAAQPPDCCGLWHQQTSSHKKEDKPRGSQLILG